MPPLCCHSPSLDCECERYTCTDTVMPYPVASCVPGIRALMIHHRKRRVIETLTCHVTLLCFYCCCCCCCLFRCVPSVKCTEGWPCHSSLSPNHDKSSSASWCRHQVKQKIKKAQYKTRRNNGYLHLLKSHLLFALSPPDQTFSRKSTDVHLQVLTISPHAQVRLHAAFMHTLH